MKKYHGNTVEYWKQNAEEDYLTTPISVLKYINVLEEQAEQLRIHDVVEQNEQLFCDVCGSNDVIEAPHMGKNCNRCNPFIIN